jgi:hypothetical protein
VNIFTVHRSPLRQFMFGVAGLILVLAAIDIVWAHKLAEAPMIDASGNLTSRGQVDRRHDLMWGSLFLLVGGGTVLVAIAGLVRRQPMLEIQEDGVAIRLLSANETMHIPFHRILWARSSSEDSSDASIRPRQLLIGVDDPARFSDQLWGAEWRDDVLRIDTDGWSETAEEIAIRIGIDKARAEVRATNPGLVAAGTEDEPGEGFE